MADQGPVPGRPSDIPGEPEGSAVRTGAVKAPGELLEETETGNSEVDAVLARLGALDGTPTDARLVVYEDVHQRLRGTLTALDHRPGLSHEGPRS